MDEFLFPKKIQTKIKERKRNEKVFNDPGVEPSLFLGSGPIKNPKKETLTLRWTWYTENIYLYTSNVHEFELSFEVILVEQRRGLDRKCCFAHDNHLLIMLSSKNFPGSLLHLIFISNLFFMEWIGMLFNNFSRESI